MEILTQGSLVSTRLWCKWVSKFGVCFTVCSLYMSSLGNLICWAVQGVGLEVVSFFQAGSNAREIPFSSAVVLSILWLCVCYWASIKFGGCLNMLVAPLLCVCSWESSRIFYVNFPSWRICDENWIIEWAELLEKHDFMILRQFVSPGNWSWLQWLEFENKHFIKTTLV